MNKNDRHIIGITREERDVLLKALQCLKDNHEYGAADVLYRVLKRWEQSR